MAGTATPPKHSSTNENAIYNLVLIFEGMWPRLEGSKRAETASFLREQVLPKVGDRTQERVRKLAG